MKRYVPMLVEGTDDQYKIYTDNRGTMLCGDQLGEEFVKLESVRVNLEKLNHALANAQEWQTSDPEDSEMDRDSQVGNWIERALDAVREFSDLTEKSE